MSTSARFFFSDTEKMKIIDTIKEAEKLTSGEIRVHLENTFKGDIFDNAVFIFEKLKMHKTKNRNAVLIYVAVKKREFAIIGDAGINHIVGQDFWDDVKILMTSYFIEEKYAEGLCQAIIEVGKKLKNYFPYKNDDVNELPDTISIGNN